MSKNNDNEMSEESKKIQTAIDKLPKDPETNNTIDKVETSQDVPQLLLDREVEATENSSAPKYIPFDVIVGLFSKNPNLTYKQVGKLLNCSGQAIQQRCAKKGYTPQRIANFRKVESDLLSLSRADILSTLSVEDIKGMSPKDRAVMYGIFHDKEFGKTVKVEHEFSELAHLDKYKELVERGKAIKERLEGSGVQVEQVAELVENGEGVFEVPVGYDDKPTVLGGEG